MDIEQSLSIAYRKVLRNMETIQKIALVASGSAKVTAALSIFTYANVKFNLTHLDMVKRSLFQGITASDYRYMGEHMATKMGLKRTIPILVEGVRDLRCAVTGGAPESEMFTAIYAGVGEGIDSVKGSFERVADNMDAKGVTHTPSLVEYVFTPKQAMLRAISVNV